MSNPEPASEQELELCNALSELSNLFFGNITLEQPVIWKTFPVNETLDDSFLEEGKKYFNVNESEDRRSLPPEASL